jgi:hypothetical protein
MGDSSRLYNILVSVKNGEEERKDKEFRSLQGLSSSFVRFSKGIRRSFNKIRTLRSKTSREKSEISNRDSGFETSQVGSKHEYCESLDSGLESDESLEISAGDKTSDKSIQTQDEFKEYSSYTEISRTRSNRSSRTLDSGILCRTSPGCLVTHRIHNVPKKKVSILLPGESRNRTPFGPHLQVERTQILTAQSPIPTKGTVSTQREDVMINAMQGLLSMHPTLCDTIFLIFQPDPNLRSLGSGDIGNLLFNLKSILYRNFDSVPYFETCLFMVQMFLLRVISILNHIPALSRFPNLIRDLLNKSQKLGYLRSSFLLQETQELYIELWCSLISEF